MQEELEDKENQLENDLNKNNSVEDDNNNSSTEKVNSPVIIKEIIRNSFDNFIPVYVF